MKNKLIIIAQIESKPEKLDFVKSELSKLLEPTRKEEGCIKYDLHQDNSNPNIFIFYEVWENKNFLEKHLSSPHLTGYVKATEDAISNFTINEMSLI